MSLLSEIKIIKAATKKYTADSGKLDFRYRVYPKKSNIDKVNNKVYLRNKESQLLVEYYFEFNEIYSHEEWNNRKANQSQYEKAIPRTALFSVAKASLIVLFYFVGSIVAVFVWHVIKDLAINGFTTSIAFFSLFLLVLILIQHLVFK
jgi:hypothetical protein